MDMIALPNTDLLTALKGGAGFVWKRFTRPNYEREIRLDHGESCEKVNYYIYNDDEVRCLTAGLNNNSYSVKIWHHSTYAVLNEVVLHKWPFNKILVNGALLMSGTNSGQLKLYNLNGETKYNANIRFSRAKNYVGTQHYQ